MLAIITKMTLTQVSLIQVHRKKIFMKCDLTASLLFFACEVTFKLLQ